MTQIQTEVIFLNLLRQTDEFILSIVGTNPEGDAGSFRKRVLTLFASFQSDGAGFVASSVQVGFLATLLKEYAAFKLTPIEQIGTPEILIGQIRWDDIYDKPDIVGGSSDWDDITGKPATFPPSTHAHAYADVTEKPATFPPSTHAHAYADVTGKPATFPLIIAPVYYTGNGNASRVLSFTSGITPRYAIISRLDGTYSYNCYNNVHLSDIGNGVATTDINNAGVAFIAFFLG